MGYLRTIIWAAGGILLAQSGFALDKAFNAHEIKDQPVVAICEECHSEKPDVFKRPTSLGTLPDWDKYKGDGSVMCLVCHDIETAAHPMTDAKIDFSVPADLPLAEDSTLSCMTCHYLHGSLSSDRPWASVSFMDRMSGSERMHKTYLLRRNNADGELCLVCHNPKGEK
jgi:hypothetical protein